MPPLLLELERGSWLSWMSPALCGFSIIVREESYNTARDDIR